MGVSAFAAVTLATAAYGQDQARKQKHAQEKSLEDQQSAISSALANNPEPVMPTADGSAVEKAKQASIAEQVARRGRASTILSQPQDRLGS